MANPTLQEIINRCNADFVNQFDDIDPTLPQSMVGCFPEMIAGRSFEINGAFSLLVQRLLLNTTSDDFTDQWGSAYNVRKNVATPSSGRVVFTGSLGSLMPTGTILNSTTGIQYETTSAGAILPYQDLAASFDVDGVTVTVTTSTDHNLATGVTINVAPANLPAQIIGSYPIIVTASNEFSYTTSVSAATGTYPNGTITTSAGSVLVSAVSFGENTNALSGAQLTLSSQISGVSNTAFIAFGGLTGGADVEDSESYRSRVLYRVRNPIAYSSPSSIKNLLLSFNGITRVWVRRVFPAIGQFTVYYVRDNNIDTVFPAGSDLVDVRDKIPTPAEIPESSIHVEAPVNRAINFTFADLQPNTTTMLDAVKAALGQFFRDVVTMGFEQSTITVNQYTRPIQTAVDQTTGESINDFTLSLVDGVAPANLTIADNELPTLGVVDI